MYEEFFGLTEKPFSIQPDPSFLYWGRGHRLAYAMLEYGVLNHAGISVITGEVGCGKTTLVHRLLDQLSDTHAVALLSNIQQGRGDLLSWVLMGFGQSFAGKTHVELFAQLQSFFIGEYAKGRRIVLIIDEAQNLSVDQLEEIRMLSNINAGKDQLLQLILVGQPELKDLLNRPDMLQLAQRVGSDFHLTPLSREEVDAYIDTRLTIAGAARRIFAERAVDVIAHHSRGVPRVINIICDTALVYAFSQQSPVVDDETIETVIRDKADYGVFGLATDQKTVLRSDAGGRDAGPRLFVNDDAAPAQTLRAERPALKSVAGEDQPRMPPAPRRRPRAVANEAFDERREPVVDARASALAVAPDEAPAPLRPAAALSPGEPRTMEAAAPASPRPATNFPDPAFAAVEDARAALALVGVVVIQGEGSPEAAIRSAAGACDLVFVAQETAAGAIAAARAAGADVVEVADKALTPGRARNAGYRQLKKKRPELAYIQFLEAGVALDPGWLREAARFMERRPEVAALEGVVRERGAALSPFNRAAEIADCAEAGEAQTTGSTVLVRADAFEGAGGFRGDLVVNETRDLCIRLRRRGAHMWRLDADMGVRDSNLKTFKDWWARSTARGFAFAHGSALHGAPPDRLFGPERARALLWGAIIPAVTIFGALFGALFTAIAAPFGQPLIVAAAILVAGVLAYGGRIAFLALRRGGEPGAWPYAIWSTVGCAPEFIGAWRYHFAGSRGRGAQRPDE